MILEVLLVALTLIAAAAVWRCRTGRRRTPAGRNGGHSLETFCPFYVTTSTMHLLGGKRSTVNGLPLPALFAARTSPH